MVRGRCELEHLLQLALQIQLIALQLLHLLLGQLLLGHVLGDVDFNVVDARVVQIGVLLLAERRVRLGGQAFFVLSFFEVFGDVTNRGPITSLVLP